MVFTYRQFEVEIHRQIKIEQISWPKPGEAMDEECLGCNRCYADLRRLPWREARRVYALEEEYIERIVNSLNFEREYELIEEEMCVGPGIYGLDIGVASTVIALSSANCIPFTSCNAGVFGGHHTEVYPVVGFYVRIEVIPILLECAEVEQVGLENTGFGSLVVYSDDIRKMRRFAHAISDRSGTIRSLFVNKKAISTVKSSDSNKRLKQITLDL